jgi:hypothetical protein
MDPPGGGVQRRVQGERSVPVVFKTIALSATRREPQHRVEPIQRLNGGLLIDTKHSRMLGRIQVEPDNVGGFGLSTSRLSTLSGENTTSKSRPINNAGLARFPKLTVRCRRRAKGTPY